MRKNIYNLSSGQPRPKNNGVEKVSFTANIVRDGTIIKRAWKRGDEINVSVPPPLKKASAWDLNDYFELRQLRVHQQTF
jgi:hypothetical protein